MGRVRALFDAFLLRGAGRGDASDDERSELRKTLARAAEKRDAAEAVWLAGIEPEANRLAREAAELLENAAAGRTGFERSVAELRRAESYREIEAAEVRVARALRIVAATDRELRLRRAARVLLALAAAAGVAVLAVRVAQRPRPLSAVASVVLNAEAVYDGSRAVDRRPETEWLAPDGSVNATLEVFVEPGRKIRRVSLLNAQNAPQNDRATRDYRLELLDEHKALVVIDDFFGAPSDKPSWKEHYFANRPRVTKVRITLKSYFGRGCGLAEVLVE